MKMSNIIMLCLWVLIQMEFHAMHIKGEPVRRDKPFKGNVEGCDPRYSFRWIGKSNTVYVFEAPIDMLSFISMYQR